MTSLVLRRVRNCPAIIIIIIIPAWVIAISSGVSQTIAREETASSEDLWHFAHKVKGVG